MVYGNIWKVVEAGNTHLPDQKLAAAAINIASLGTFLSVSATPTFTRRRNRSCSAYALYDMFRVGTPIALTILAAKKCPDELIKAAQLASLPAGCACVAWGATKIGVDQCHDLPRIVRKLGPFAAFATAGILASLPLAEAGQALLKQEH